jgi:CHAT domain-containing protein
MDRQAVPRDSVARLVAVIRAQFGADDALGRTVRSLEPNDGLPRRDRPAAGNAERSATRRSRAVFDAAVTVVVPASLTSRLPPGGELVVVPHGPLALVSFAAMPVGSAHEPPFSGEPLGARYAIRYAPSLTILRLIAARDDARPIPSRAGRVSVGSAALVVGNPAMPRVPVARGGTARLPSLPAAEREGIWVAQALGTRALTAGAATERAVRARMAAAPVIHLATHGFAYSADAKVLDSFVALAPDSTAGGAGNGLLTVGEVIDDVPHLTADLVVLSACQTGLGNLKQAEGTVGLQRAFLAKGARSVLVSLWSVSDRATELVMRGFYTHWLRDADNPGKAEALRRAQEDVRRAPGFADPRYWAAFQLVGAP